MARFKRARASDTVRADWWDEGVLPDGTPWQETATFRPALTTGLSLEIAMVLDPRLAELKAKVEARGLSDDLLKSLTERLTGTCTLFVALDSWTFREDATPEQEAAGEPGTIADLTLETLAELAPRDFGYLVSQLAARIGTDFRNPSAPGGPDAGESRLPTGAAVRGERVRSRRKRAAGTSDPPHGDHLLPVPLPA